MVVMANTKAQGRAAKRSIRWSPLIGLAKLPVFFNFPELFILTQVIL